jgi:mono/diheme cytochrome c family protein
MKKIILSFTTLILLSCASRLYVPKEAANSNNDVADLKEGRTLYVNNCANCHQLYMPNQFNKTDWAYNLNQMQARANITNEQKELIYSYLAQASKN